MRKISVVLFVSLLASLLASCVGAEAPAGIVAPTQTAWVVTAPDAVATSVAATAMPVVVSNSLVNPELFDAGEDPAGEQDAGLFDIGVNPSQIGIVFGWDLSWNGNTIPGEGCEIVVLSGGWYENFKILDGRYEIYTLPSSDPAGWTKVLVEQRVAEQAAHYGCGPKAVPTIWEGGK
jgi:hypothetical protein